LASFIDGEAIFVSDIKTIKRYPNRKLYDTVQSKYITLEEIGSWLREGGEIRVLDSRSSEDITAVTLAQVLVGEEKRSQRLVPIQRLVGFLQTGGEFIQRKIGTPVSSLRGEAEKTMQRIFKTDPSEELRDLVLKTHRAYEDVQHRVDDRLQMILSAARNLATLAQEIETLKNEVAQLRGRLEQVEKQPRTVRKG